MESPEPTTWTETDLISIQSQIRGYVARKTQVDPLKEVIVLDATAPVKNPLGENGELTNVPDKMTKEAKEKMAKLGDFVYKLKVAGGSGRPPVEMSDGSVYIGQWLGQRRYGRGKLLTADGGLAEGYWNGDLHLQGRIILPLGEHYEGGINMGYKEGYGRFEDLSGGGFYEGDWLEDKRHGHGIEHIADGSVYEGAFMNDQKNGKGAFKWASGESYEGEFKDSVIHGTGKYVWNENKWYEGEWMEGKMHGVGKFMNEGKEYIGDFVQDKKQGKGTYKWEGNVYEGDYKDNKMHGKGYLTMKGKDKKLYAFENNKRGVVITEPDQN